MQVRGRVPMAGASRKMAAKTSVEYQLFDTGRFGCRGYGSSVPPLGVRDLGGSPSNAKAAIPQNRAAIVRRAEPRESHDSPDPPVGSGRAPSPPSHAKNKNAESRAHPRKSRPPPRRRQLSGALATRPTKAEARPGGCDAPTRKNRAGKRRDHRLNASPDSFLGS